MKLNKNFWKVLLPFHIVAIVGLFNLQYYPWLLFFWVIFGVMGNGLAGHRYFAHSQFECHAIVRWVLGMLATLGAYAPISYWRIQHLHHHANSDNKSDVHSPNTGSAFNTFYGWILTDSTIEFVIKRDRVAIKVMRDKFYSWFFRNHYKIIYAFSLILLIINPYIFSMYCLAYAIDIIRLGSVNYFCHKSGYRLFDTKDKSTNNFLVGILGFGFGWHNTHHAFPNRLILTERWWELDIEGCIGWLISNNKPKLSSKIT